MTALCAAYEVSRKTGYKWLGRYFEAGPDGLEERSRAPRRHGRAMAPAVAAPPAPPLAVAGAPVPGGGGPLFGQPGDEGCGVPVPVRHCYAQARPARRPAMAGCHVGLSPGLVDEDKLIGIESGPAGAPCATFAQNVRPFLLRRVAGLFFASSRGA